MIRFVDLNNGKTFNGDPPYVHWMGDCCSTNMIYNLPICFISDKQDLNIELNSNIFSLLDTKKLGEKIRINNFEYEDINNLKTTNILSTGTLYEQDIYIHIIYITGSSDVEAEYLDNFIIEGNKYIIGLAVYDNYEANNINLSNFGINIPNSIQKSIYSSNVHEDKDDNILLNRKWRELLTNYWDVVANKGSYDSTINSIKWFDWGNLLKIREFWKYEEFSNINKTILEDRNITEFITEKYKDTICRFSKTTYLGLYVAMQELTGAYDKYKNPILKNIVFDWSKIDIMLKLSLLGSFYETYFLPIHADLIHSTIEDIVFTDLFKVINSTSWGREDYIYDSKYIKSNINDNDIFHLGNVTAQVGKDTLFKTVYNRDINNDIINNPKYDDIEIIGVQDEITELGDNEDDLKSFWSQYYNGIGVIIPFKFTIDLKNDFIKTTSLFVKRIIENKEYWVRRESYKLFKPNDKNQINIDFNILFKNEGNQDLRIQFISGGGQIFTKRVIFNIKDASTPILKLFRIKHITEKLSTDLLNTDWVNDYITSRFSSSNILQHIPLYLDKSGDGIALNNILIFNGVIDKQDSNYGWFVKNYFINYKFSGRYNYTIGISKEFWFDPSPYITGVENIYRNDYGYFPQFHKLEEITGDNLESYTIFDNDSVCIIPVLKSGDCERFFKYGKDIDDYEWVFKNISRNEIISSPTSIKEPYITNPKQLLPNGYYSVIFKYRMGTETKELRLDSAFVKK